MCASHGCARPKGAGPYAAPRSIGSRKELSMEAKNVRAKGGSWPSRLLNAFFAAALAASLVHFFFEFESEFRRRFFFVCPRIA